MKTIWEWLDIDCTTDSQVIKKAYANQAKKYHPEENPEEFKQLRSAYKTAMKYAAASKSMAAPIVINIPKTPDIELRKPEVNIYEPLGKIDEQSELSDGDNTFEYNFRREKRAALGQEDGQERQEEYHYKFDGDQRDKERNEVGEQPEYIYRLDKDDYREEENNNRQDKQQNRQEQQHFVYDRESFDFAMGQRLKAFLRQIDIIYADNFMRNRKKAWKMLFRHYEYKGDFENHDFVAAVVDALEQMPRIGKETRKYIGKRLFASCHDDVKMRYLKERYYNQQPQKIKQETYQKPKDVQLRYIAGKLYGRQSTIYKRYNLINNIVALISICFFGVLMEYAFSISGNDDEQPEMTMSTKFITETHGEIIILERLEVYKEMYTKDSPFLSDVSGDGYADIVYYDMDTDEFLVQEYDPQSLNYMQAENVKDYYKKNPKSRVKLFRFIQEDK